MSCNSCGENECCCKLHPILRGLLLTSSVLEASVAGVLLLCPALLSGAMFDPRSMSLVLINSATDSFARQEMLWVGGPALRAFGLGVTPAALASIAITSAAMLYEDRMSRATLIGLASSHLFATFCIPMLSFNFWTLQLPAILFHPQLAIGLGAYALFGASNSQYGLSFLGRSASSSSSCCAKTKSCKCCKCGSDCKCGASCKCCKCEGECKCGSECKCGADCKCEGECKCGTKSASASSDAKTGKASCTCCKCGENCKCEGDCKCCKCKGECKCGSA